MIDRLREAQQVRRLVDPEWTISDDLNRAKRDVAELAAAVANTRRDQATESCLRARVPGLEGAYTCCLLTGRPVRISLIPDERKCVPDPPTGPLICFLQEFYHCVRTRLAALDGNRDTADMEARNPEPETLVGWVTAFDLDRTQSRT